MGEKAKLIAISDSYEGALEEQLVYLNDPLGKIQNDAYAMARSATKKIILMQENEQGIK